MGKVKNILYAKGHDVFTVTPDLTVYEGLQLMVEKQLGSLLIVENDQLVGIFTERDYARKLILQGKASKDTPIGEVMTENPTCVSPEDSVEHCMKLMVGKTIRHLPVMEKDQLVGLIAISDVLKFIIDEQRYIIDSLEHYITDSN